MTGYFFIEIKHSTKYAFPKLSRFCPCAMIAALISFFLHVPAFVLIGSSARKLKRGGANLLGGRGRGNIRPKTELFEKVLEYFVFTELKAFLEYSKDPRALSFWRSKSGYEVDFLIGEEVAIEVKSCEMVTERHCKGLKALAEEKLGFRKRIVVSMDSAPRRIEGVDIYPLKVFLTKLWNKEF